MFCDTFYVAFILYTANGWLAVDVFTRELQPAADEYIGQTICTKISWKKKLRDFSDSSSENQIMENFRYILIKQSHVQKFDGSPTEFFIHLYKYAKMFNEEHHIQIINSLAGHYSL